MTQTVLNGDGATSTREPVLVSGASFAGLATALWLDRLGYHVTVVEIAPGLWRGGTPVDIEGPAFDALARMGLIEVVRAKALPPRSMSDESPLVMRRDRADASHDLSLSRSGPSV